jgi:hypothetical protein
MTSTEATAGVVEDERAVRAVLEAALFAGPLAGSKAAHDVQDIRFLTASVAVVIGCGALCRPVRPSRDRRARRLAARPARRDLARRDLP